MSSSLKDLQLQYQNLESTAHMFATALTDQIQHLLTDNNIPLGAPIESRVKEWDSVADKIERKHIDLKKLSDLSDLVGVRLMLLFKRDVDRSSEIICGAFTVIEKEDTVARLSEDQFGYQSLHLQVQMPRSWLKVPSLAAFANMKAEIQIRTLAQHIWAGASHHLQYKRTSGVPLPIRRSIHRVSALLETVDLEFERVLEERAAYQARIAQGNKEGLLNVDLLAQVLDEVLPAANKFQEENYGELIDDLGAFGIDTVNELKDLVKETYKEILNKDASWVKLHKASQVTGLESERIDRGVYFTHIGLIRQALKEKFGQEKWAKRFRTRGSKTRKA